MAIEIKNFNPVWKYIQPTVVPALSATPQYYDGTYMFVQCSIPSGNQITVNASLYDKKPEFIPGPDTGSAPVYNDAKILAYLNYGNVTADVEGNVLLTAHEYIVSHSLSNNPGVEFNIINLSGSIA